MTRARCARSTQVERPNSLLHFFHGCSKFMLDADLFGNSPSTLVVCFCFGIHFSRFLFSRHQGLACPALERLAESAVMVAPFNVNGPSHIYSRDLLHVLPSLLIQGR